MEMQNHNSISRIEAIKIENYCVLKDMEMKNLTPFSVFLGPYGSGKSTIFDLFAFLSECFTIGLRKAWEKRGRFKELRTRDAEGPIRIELKYKESEEFPAVTYFLEIDEGEKGPFVAEENLRWSRGSKGLPFTILDFKKGKGIVTPSENPDSTAERISEQLDSEEMLAVNTLGQFAKHPRVSSLRRFIADWYMSYLGIDNTKGVTEVGPAERLSSTGDNLPNVIQYLKEQFPERLQEIVKTMRHKVPRLESVEAEPIADGRLALQVKDAPFDRPVLAKYVSDGTLKMLAYLTLLYDPSPPQLIGIEEPENYLYPELLPELSEECRKASEHSQLFVTTHSPFFVNGIKANELWILERDESGYTKARRASDIKGIHEFMEEGALLGHLWMEKYFHPRFSDKPK